MNPTQQNHLPAQVGGGTHACEADGGRRFTRGLTA